MQAFYELYAQGTFWCPHLNYPDPIVLMPLLIGAINLAITEVFFNFIYKYLLSMFNM